MIASTHIHNFVRWLATPPATDGEVLARLGVAALFMLAMVGLAVAPFLIHQWFSERRRVRRVLKKLGVTYHLPQR